LRDTSRQVIRDQHALSAAGAVHVSAAKFWMLNRRRAQWSDTSRHELTGRDGGEIVISERPDLNRARRIAYILSQAVIRKAEL
jgi:hypothetical protein